MNDCNWFGRTLNRIAQWLGSVPGPLLSCIFWPILLVVAVVFWTGVGSIGWVIAEQFVSDFLTKLVASVGFCTLVGAGLLYGMFNLDREADKLVERSTDWEWDNLPF